MTEAPERICEACGAPVTENVHGEIWHADLAHAQVAAALERAAEACWHGLHDPEDPLDAYGWMKSDTPERHASMVLEWNLWKMANAIRALITGDQAAALEAVRREAVEAERERCINIAESQVMKRREGAWNDGAYIAAAIRENTHD
ncbi:hypothetical protein [Maritimibacter sp. UBA3975]|uniref:hypothetical protein n=1 Tax=Maritimibacter sp. UBA3975 TaxID=1946833 RepID=UPI000C092B11|nr:hypothetical protein [Maritimibacter sp. UBA3975]MAM60820.1 hypothetical protein [Maritimibacter sp.]|tara:strand:+ start:11220 stop:11657 length:438 start_codon:yes stop_codon:yes gene_type:complete